ncbi:MAG: hypothetical protein V1707_00585 [bacterium]
MPISLGKLEEIFPLDMIDSSGKIIDPPDYSGFRGQPKNLFKQNFFFSYMLCPRCGAGLRRGEVCGNCH